MAQVKIEHVDKVYPGNVKAVDDVSLEIKDGEFVALVGPSGCGKSTTLRMVAGLEEISQGTITIGGQVVNDVPPKDRDIAMVFQNYALYPHMTVRENMAFGLKLRKFPKDEIARRVDEAAKILGIGDLLDRRPKALSGGQRQRVAVGRAIVRKPAVFLFDEPLSNLDAKMRIQMRVEISRLHAQLGATMLYVTHDQVEAMTMGQRIVVMKEGVVQQVDDPIALYDRPVNRFVAGFIGTPPMNFIEGTIQKEELGWVFEEGRDSTCGCRSAMKRPWPPMTENPSSWDCVPRILVLQWPNSRRCLPGSMLRWNLWNRWGRRALSITGWPGCPWLAGLMPTRCSKRGKVPRRPSLSKRPISLTRSRKSGLADSGC